MKRILVSASLVAIGTVSLHADEYAPDFTAMDATKPWTVSGTLRGFYDDNFTTSPNGHKQGSAGFEFSPQGSLIVPLQQTELGLRYTYGLYYYQQRENQGANPIDQTQQVDLWVDHAFNQRWEGKVQDSFISSQEPQLTSSGTALPYRAEGNNIQNVGTLSAHTEWSMLFSSDVSYQNTWLDYHQSGTTVAGLESGAQSATYAGLLNQIDQAIGVNLNYQYLPDLAFMVGYSFEWANYTGDEPIALGPTVGDVAFSDSRNSMSHTFKVGAQYTATANLSIIAWAGFTYNDNYKLPSYDTQDSTSIQPYADIAVTYTYLPGDYVQVGFTESGSPVATAFTSSTGSLTLYQQTAVFYATVNHQITPKLTGSLVGHYQYSSYVGGGEDGVGQDWYSLGFNLGYAFTPWVSADAGYNFYYLTSTRALPGYSRNVGYASVTASF